MKLFKSSAAPDQNPMIMIQDDWDAVCDAYGFDFPTKEELDQSKAQEPALDLSFVKIEPRSSNDESNILLKPIHHKRTDAISYSVHFHLVYS